jgi:Uma2 family endonuclease
LTPRDHGRQLRLEEFEHADGKEGYDYELIDGRLAVSPVPDMPHDEVLKWLRRLLEEYVDQHPEAINLISTAARVFVPGRAKISAPEPDIAAYKDFPLDLPFGDRHWRDHSPVLVVEILSPDNVEKDWERNRRFYLEVPSIREYWILDPLQDADRPSLTVYRRRGQHWQRPIHVAFGATYTTRLLPGFSLVVDPHQ